MDGGVYLRGPVVEGEQVDSDEDINAVDGDGNDEQEPEVAVRKRREAACRLEVFEVLVFVSALAPGSNRAAPLLQCTPSSGLRHQ